MSSKKLKFKVQSECLRRSMQVLFILTCKWVLCSGLLVEIIFLPVEHRSCNRVGNHHPPPPPLPPPKNHLEIFHQACFTLETVTKSHGVFFLKKFILNVCLECSLEPKVLCTHPPSVQSVCLLGPSTYPLKY